MTGRHGTIEQQQHRDSDYERHGVLDHLDCLLSCLFMGTSKITLKLRATSLSEGNPPVTGGFTSQMASNAENISIWLRHHDSPLFFVLSHWFRHGIADLPGMQRACISRDFCHPMPESGIGVEQWKEHPRLLKLCGPLSSSSQPWEWAVIREESWSTPWSVEI